VVETEVANGVNAGVKAAGTDMMNAQDGREGQPRH
jgi:hypothetical protein